MAGAGNKSPVSVNVKSLACGVRFSEGFHADRGIRESSVRPRRLHKIDRNTHGDGLRIAGHKRTRLAEAESILGKAAFESIWVSKTE